LPRHNSNCDPPIFSSQLGLQAYATTPFHHIYSLHRFSIVITSLSTKFYWSFSNRENIKKLITFIVFQPRKWGQILLATYTIICNTWFCQLYEILMRPTPVRLGPLRLDVVSLKQKCVHWVTPHINLGKMTQVSDEESMMECPWSSY
jgi:hypothetical protein